MPDIITMPDELYRVVLAKFNPSYLNASSGPGNFNPVATINGPSAVFWQPEFTFAISDKDTFLLYRRFVMKLRGGKVLCRLSDPTMWAEVFGTQPRGSGGSGPVDAPDANTVYLCVRGQRRLKIDLSAMEITFGGLASAATVDRRAEQAGELERFGGTMLLGWDCDAEDYRPYLEVDSDGLLSVELGINQTLDAAAVGALW